MALEYSGSADNVGRNAEHVGQAQLNPEHYQAGRDNRTQNANVRDTHESNTVSIREMPVEFIAACTQQTLKNIESRNTPISAAGLKNLVNVMQLHQEAPGLYGKPEGHAGVSPSELQRFGGMLTLQAENHPDPNAKAAIKAVVDKYFTPAQA